MRKEHWTAYWMAAPALVAVLAIIVYPLAFATYYSLREVRANLVGEFVGLANYAGILQDPNFTGALTSTLLFTAASAGLSLVLGLGLALLPSQPFPGRGAVVAAAFLPWIFPAVATATFGRLALGDQGFVQCLLEALGLTDGGPLLVSRSAMLCVAVLVDVWRATPFVALLLLAGMRTTPQDIHEAASVEGASALQRFFWITLPLLKPTLLIVLLIRLLDAFRGRQAREAFTLAAVAGGTSLALLGALSATTGGGFFFHTVTANVNEFRWEQVASNVYASVGLMPVMAAGGTVFLVLARRGRVETRWLVGTYLTGAVATAILVGKVGSDVNYLLELSAALSLAVGTLLAWCARRPRLRAGLLLVLAVQVVLMVQASQFLYAGFQSNVIAQKAEISELKDIVENAEGPVLADESMGLLPLVGRRIQLQPFEFSQLSRAGVWDQRPLLRSIERREFRAILIFEPPGATWLVQERWTDEMLGAIKVHYEPAGSFADTVVYRPR